MHLDVTTVVATGAFIALLTGGFLIATGTHFREAPTAAIWGAANLFTAFGMILALEADSFSLAFLCLLIATALTWSSVARFHYRRVPEIAFILGALTWMAASGLPFADLSFGESASILMVAMATFLGGAAFELWRGRTERLRARWPLFALLVADAASVLFGATQVLRYTVAPAVPAGGSMWLVYLTAIGFIVGSAVFLVAMIKERAVAGQLKAAGTDSLTGVANRGALMRAAGAAIAASQATGRPLAVVLLDLDRFKQVNDTYGHRAGDLVLQRFAECARKNLRAGDIVGRIGGEEFAAVFPGVAADAAALLVERLRAAFAGDATWMDGTRIEATVSGGIAEYRPLRDPADLDQLFHRADRALYAAKAGGRNRVELDDDHAAATVVPDIAHSAA